MISSDSPTACYSNDLIYVLLGSARLQVLQSHHDTPLAGHFGVAKTVELITRNFWWPHLRQTVVEFIRSYTGIVHMVFFNRFQHRQHRGLVSRWIL